MDTEPLQNLTVQSGGVGRWLVTVVMPPREVVYSWNKGGKSGEGKKLQYLLVSEDCAQYCEGVYKRIGKEPKATDDYNKAKQKFKKCTIWTVSKVSLTKQDTQYLGCSCKGCHRHEHIILPTGAAEHGRDAIASGTGR